MKTALRLALYGLGLLVILMAPSLSRGQAIITTIAGGIGSGLGDGGPATNETLLHPHGLTFDSAGSLYIADYMNNRVRMVNTAGVISTVAGTGLQVSVGNSKLAIKTAVAGPSGVAVDSQGDLFIAEALGGHIRKVTPAGIISIVAGNGSPSSFGDGAAATSAGVTPMALALDSAGNIYIAECVDHRIRKVNTAGIISTIAGTGKAGFSGDGGPATSAQINSPVGVALDSAGNIYVAEFERVRKVDTAGIITTVAGNGQFGSILDGIPATSALLSDIPAITLDSAGNVYIVDSYRIRKIATGSVVTQTPPAITANGVVNAAGLQPVIVPNSWVTIFGTNLASKTDNWTHAIVNGQLPTSLGGVSVTIGGKPAYVSVRLLYFARTD